MGLKLYPYLLIKFEFEFIRSSLVCLTFPLIKSLIQTSTKCMFFTVVWLTNTLIWRISTASWELKGKITVLLEAVLTRNASRIPRMLIQFWEPVLIEGRTLLTTRRQPFAINSIHEGLCRYRAISESYKFYVDKQQIKDELGLLGRVFVDKLPECSPNIEYYTVKEYPQRQDALRWQITGVNAYPVLDPSRQSCIGVLEVAQSTKRDVLQLAESTKYINLQYPNYSKVGDLKILDLRWHRYRTIAGKAFNAASKEMKETSKKVCEAHNLDSAQTWAMCCDCMSKLVSLSSEKLGGRKDLDDLRSFRDMCDSLHLREGQGVVGQALSSHGLIYCSDITQFSVVEYPLAHFAKYHGLCSSFAICLRSSHTGSHLYVLEFFLPSSPIINESVINLLRNILGTMKLHFQNFKLASGKDWGEKLPIEVVDYRNGEKYCYTMEVESQTTTSPESPPETIQDEGEIMQQSRDKVANAEQSNINCTLQDEGEILQQDPSSQQSIDKVANAEQSNINCTLQDEGEILQQYPSSQQLIDKVANAGQSNINCTLQDEGEILQEDLSSQQSIDKVANAEQSNINCTSSPGNGTSKNLKRPQSKTGIQLSLNDILRHAKKKVADAAEALNVSRSTLKRICREHGVNRWPPRNIKENCSLPQGDDDRQQILHPSYGMPSSSNQVMPTITPTNSHDTMMLDVNFVNVKAKHIKDVIRFKLLLSSGLAELQHEITKRLKLTGGTYDIKYEDEEKDLVLITCDEDVQDWMHTCGSQGSNSLKLFLMPK